MRAGDRVCVILSGGNVGGRAAGRAARRGRAAPGAGLTAAHGWTARASLRRRPNRRRRPHRACRGSSTARRSSARCCPPPSLLAQLAAARPRVPEAVLGIPSGSGRWSAARWTSCSGATRACACRRSTSASSSCSRSRRWWRSSGSQALTGVPLFDPFAPPTPVDNWIALAAVPAVLGYLVASIEARTLSTAVVGGGWRGGRCACRSRSPSRGGGSGAMLAAQCGGLDPDPRHRDDRDPGGRRGPARGRADRAHRRRDQPRSRA